MNCYYHPDIVAVGLCKHCSRALCNECAADQGHGLACREIHENEVRKIDRLIQTNIKADQEADKNMWISPLFKIVMGSVFVGFGAIYSQRPRSFYFSIIFGLVFIVFGLISAWRLYRIFGNKK